MPVIPTIEDDLKFKQPLDLNSSKMIANRLVAATRQLNDTIKEALAHGMRVEADIAENLFDADNPSLRPCVKLKVYELLASE